MKSPDKFDKNSKYSSIFLSYSSKDRKFVKNLAESLERKGVEVWFDKTELKASNSLFRKIGPAINKADFFAVILSNNAINSEWVQREIEVALSKEFTEKRDFIIPLLLENVPIPDFLQPKVNIDFTSSDKFEESFEELLDTLLKEPPEPTISDKFYPNNFIPELEYFVGRTKLLKDLKDQLKITHRASIHDISGLGKTFTTYKFADENQDDYEKIFFVRANKEEMMQNLAEISVLLNSSLKDEQDQSKQAQGFKNWLEKNNNWLVIYDNVDIPVELKPFVPLNKEGDCIFTSNFSSVKNLGKEIEITKLDKDDAQSLLFSRANSQPQSKIEFPDDTEQKAFENIIKEIDGLPVSLNTTGAFINKNAISFAEFERKMNRTPEILVKNEDGFDYYQNKSALKAFLIAIDDIAEKKDDDEFENSPELAQKLFFAAGFIAPDNIPEILLQNILQEITQIDFESENNEDLWLEIRRKLLEYDLLKYNNKFFRTHRLIQKVTQLKPSVEEQKILILADLRAIDALFPWSEYETWKECDLYLSHSMSVIKFVKNLNTDSDEIARNYEKISRHFRERVQYQSAIEYLNEAIDEYQKLFGNKNINIVDCLNVLSLVYIAQGKYDEAIELRLRCIEINETIFGKTHSRIATDLNNLAFAFQLQGRYDEAIELLKKTLDIDEKTIGKEHSEYARHLNNLATVYRLQGNYDEAIELSQQAVIISEKTIGKEHPDYATRLDNLANVYQLQSKYDEAIDLHREALTICEKTVGQQHPDYAAGLSNLALVYRSQGKYIKAIELFNQALAIDEKISSKEHPDYATDLNNLAGVYKLQKKYDKAIELFKESLRIFEITLPENHPYILKLRERIARCQEKLEKK